MERVWAFLIVVGLSLVGVFGDVFVKNASLQAVPWANRNLYLGMGVFALTAIGWVVAFQHLTLATVGIVYTVSTVLFLTLAGWLLFGEKLTPIELLAMGLGLASILLLSRFA